MGVRWAKPVKGCDSTDARERGGKRTHVADHKLGTLYYIFSRRKQSIVLNHFNFQKLCYDSLLYPIDWSLVTALGTLGLVRGHGYEWAPFLQRSLNLPRII